MGPGSVKLRAAVGADLAFGGADLAFEGHWKPNEASGEMGIRGRWFMGLGALGLGSFLWNLM